MSSSRKSTAVTERQPQRWSPCRNHDKKERVQYDDKNMPSKVICKSWIKTSPFTGEPKYNNFRQIVEDVSTVLNDGDILVQGILWTVDNYLRTYQIPIGSVMIGEQLGRVIASKNADFPVHTMLVSSQGWRTFSVFNPTTTPALKVPTLDILPYSLCLDILGMPGILAYFAVIHKCPVQSGDTVLVNAAAGPVGNIVGQLAKIKGCCVIGFCRSAEKSSWIRSLGFDHVFNSNQIKASSALVNVAPEGVDVYFDCSGAEFTLEILQCLKPDGVMCMFGQSAAYNHSTLTGHRQNPYNMVVMRKKEIEYDCLTNHRDIFPQAQSRLLAWIQQGQLQYSHQMFCGFQMLPTVLSSLHSSCLVGKLVIFSSAFKHLLHVRTLNNEPCKD